MKTSIFTFTRKDVLDAAINAAVAAIIIGLYGVVTKEGFDLFHVNWVALGHDIVNWAFAAFVGSLGKDFLTTKGGNVLGLISVKK